MMAQEEENRMQLIAREFARLHALPVVIPENFGGIFDTIEQYIRLLPEKFDDRQLQERYDSYFPSKNDLLADFLDLKSKIMEDNLAVIYSHNDLVHKNILISLDESRAYIIDHEFGDLNYEGFDIGNFFIGNFFMGFQGTADIDYSRFPSPQYQRNFIRQYLEDVAEITKRTDGVTDADVERLYVLANRFSLVAHILWASWALLQAVYSTIDFDFFNYAVMWYAEYNRCRESRLSLKMVSPLETDCVNSSCTWS